MLLEKKMGVIVQEYVEKLRLNGGANSIDIVNLVLGVSLVFTL